MPPLLRQSLLLIAVFALATAIASLAGAKNLGTAMTFGQIAFAITLVALMLRSGRPNPDSEPAASADAPDQ